MQFKLVMFWRVLGSLMIVLGLFKGEGWDLWQNGILCMLMGEVLYIQMKAEEK